MAHNIYNCIWYNNYINQARPSPTDMYIETNLVLLLMRFHIHKINFIPQVIIEILLIYHFEVLWKSLKKLGYTNLMFNNQFAVSMDAFPHAKNQPHTYSHSWVVADLSFWGTWTYPIMQDSTGYFYEYLSTYCTKYPLHTWTHSWDVGYSRILQSAWSKSFWGITQDQ